MNRIQAFGVLSILALGAGAALAQAPAGNFSFFVSSKNPGKGGDLGGLAGADAHCQSLAAAVGAGSKTWHAYLSTDRVNAKDRIGKGPWYNVKGVEIAKDVKDLLGATNNKINGETALTEQGKLPNYLAGNPPAPKAQPLQHDIMTGTNDDGTATANTCRNWTSGADDVKTTLGHADRLGRNPGVNSWTNAHDSQGCSLEKLAPTGSAGLIYCFAVN
ncbi:MAG TPA: hypothetical protein VHH11_14915 [Gammaproteobacteria bacterium]|jgi:hypothetical protein|nr:hypothetical protein [Gammaproteobacteria bacterium]